MQQHRLQPPENERKDSRHTRARTEERCFALSATVVHTFSRWKMHDGLSLAMAAESTALPLSGHAYTRHCHSNRALSDDTRGRLAKREQRGCYTHIFVYRNTAPSTVYAACVLAPALYVNVLSERCGPALRGASNEYRKGSSLLEYRRPSADQEIFVLHIVRSKPSTKIPRNYCTRVDAQCVQIKHGCLKCVKSFVLLLKEREEISFMSYILLYVYTVHATTVYAHSNISILNRIRWPHARRQSRGTRVR
jgi:hypothetical protein